MAYLELKDLACLYFDPHGLLHDSYNGWTMRSAVRVSMNSAKIGLGQFMSGPSLKSGISQFITEGLESYSYEPEFDGDLPSSKMALSLKRNKKSIQIVFRHEHYCGKDDHESWMVAINSRLKACLSRGLPYYEARIEMQDNLIVIYSWFTVEVEEEPAITFLEDIVLELDAMDDE